MEETSDIIQTNLPPVFSKRPRKLKEMTPRFTVAWGRSGATPHPRLLAQRLTHCTLKPPLVLQRGPGSREEAHSKVTAGTLGRPDHSLGPDSLLGPYPVWKSVFSRVQGLAFFLSLLRVGDPPRDTLIKLEVNAISLLPVSVPAPAPIPRESLTNAPWGIGPASCKGILGPQPLYVAQVSEWCAPVRVDGEATA